MKGTALALAIITALIVAVVVGLRAGSSVADTELRLTQSSLPPAQRMVPSAPKGTAEGSHSPPAATNERNSSPEAVTAPPTLASSPSGPERIGQWLSSSTDIPTIAQNMLAGFASLDPKDHLLAASKLVSLVSDDRFDGLKRIILDPSTSVEATEFLFHDALSRTPMAKLPLLLAIMQQRQHPCATDAREALKANLGNDYGANYGQWQARIQDELKRQ